MAKVTIVMTDLEDRLDIDADFNEPGKSYDEMVANPTQAVAAGLTLIAILQANAHSATGEIIDEYGNVVSLNKESGKVQ
jgi:hypothetical protein